MDIENCGYDYTGKTVYLSPRHLSDGLNPGHSHLPNWTDQCDFNSVTGACQMDGTCKSPPAKAVPLADFFPIPSTSPRTFVPIPVPPAYGQSYFQNYFTVTDPNDTPDGPDAGDSD